MRSCERPRKRSASEARPSSVSNRYVLSIRTHGSSCRRRASSSLFRVSSFSALSSSSRAASHCSRVPVLCLVIALLPRFVFDERPRPNGCGRSSTTKLGRRAMTKHKTGKREQWLAARLELLKAEKELTRQSDELARRRQELPWVRIAKQYTFETDEGSASLADLFRGRSQLLVYHFMFGPDYTAGCPSCSA